MNAFLDEKEAGLVIFGLGLAATLGTLLRFFNLLNKLVYRLNRTNP